jgi:hypothetical protein
VITLQLGEPNLMQIVIAGITYQLSVTIIQTPSGISVVADSAVTADSTEPSDA